MYFFFFLGVGWCKGQSGVRPCLHLGIFRNFGNVLKIEVDSLDFMKSNEILKYVWEMLENFEILCELVKK